MWRRSNCVRRTVRIYVDTYRDIPARLPGKVDSSARVLLMNSLGEARSAERDTAATYRMTKAEKARLRREADELEMTSQQLFELRMFGQAKPVGRYGRPNKRPQAEELRLTG